MATTEKSVVKSRIRTPLVLGGLASFFSIMAYGISQVVARSLLEEATPPQVGSAITLFVGMLVLFGMSFRNLNRDLRAPRRSILWVALAGVLASNGAMLSFVALSKAQVVIVSPIVAVSPLMTLVLTAVFLRQVERLTLRVVLGSLLVVSGVVLVVWGNQA